MKASSEKRHRPTRAADYTLRVPFGVFVTSGMDVRIRNISINFDTGEIPPVTIEVRLDTWNHWLGIAHSESARAVESTQAVNNALSSGDDEALNFALEEEFRRSLVAISAAVFALDAFYASVKERYGTHPQAAQWRDGKLARYKQVAETFRWAWNIRPERAREIRDVLRQLYNVRDVATHAPAEFREPIHRPDIDRGVEWRFVQFRADTATSSVTASTEIIEALLANIDKAPPGLREWISASRVQFRNAVGREVREVADDSDPDS